MIQEIIYQLKHLKWRSQEPMPVMFPGISLINTREDYEKFALIRAKWIAREPKRISSQATNKCI